MKKGKALSVCLSLVVGTSVLLSEDAFAKEHSDSMFEPRAGQTEVIAHRGASAYAPEHTLIAYKKAIQMKADYVEFDLQMTKDGELVALHDTTLARTTNVEEMFPNRAPWSVKDFTLAEIKQLDAGSWFNEEHPELARKEYVGQTVPTLEEAIDLVKNFAGFKPDVYIETKAPNVYPGMEEKLIEILNEKGLIQEGRVILQSFSEESLKILDQMVPENVPLIQLISPSMIDEERMETVLDEVDHYADGVGPDKRLVTPIFMEEAQQRGLIVHPYTVNEMDEMIRLLSFGVDGMFTNYSDRLYELLTKPYILLGTTVEELTPTSVVFSTKASKEANVKIEVAADESFREKQVKTVRAIEKNDFAVQATFDNLEPNTTYFYIVQALPGKHTVSGQFQTGAI